MQTPSVVLNIGADVAKNTIAVARRIHPFAREQRIMRSVAWQQCELRDVG